MTSKIVKITPLEKCFSISWHLTNWCNYDCMYCPAEYHSNTRQYSFEQLQNHWLEIFDKTKLQNLKYKISFSGGEVTINKDFLKFAKWLRDEYSDHIHLLLVTTNGSASLNYYLKLFDEIDNISFSLHSEHADEKAFFDKIIGLKSQISAKNFLHVNIMNEFWNEERIQLYTKILDEHKISYSINDIDYSLKTRTFPILKGKTNLEIYNSQ